MNHFRNIFSSVIPLLFLLFSFSANAQLKVGVNAGAGFPTGTLGSTSKVALGVGFSGEYLLLEKKLGLGVNVNWYSFGFRYLASSGHTTILPIVAMGRYYFSTESVRPFVGLDLGAYFYKVKDDNDTYPPGGFNPGIAPVGGFVFQANDQVDINISAKYHSIFSSNYQGASVVNFLGIQLGTSILFGK